MCVKAVHRTKGNAGRAGVRRARGAGGHRQAARGTGPDGAPTNTDESTRRSSTGSSRPRRASACRSSCGRDSNCPPRPTRSPPIAVRSSRPTARKRWPRRIRKASADAAHRAATFEDQDREGEAESTRPCRSCVRPRRWRRSVGWPQNKAVGAIHFDDISAINDLGDSIAVARSDRAHALASMAPVSASRSSKDGPSVTTNLCLRRIGSPQPIGERPRPTDVGDHQEHRSQQAPRSRAGLRPVLGKHVGQRRAALGRARPALHGDQPELPPQQ